MEGARSRLASDVAALSSSSYPNCPSQPNAEAGFSLSQIEGEGAAKQLYNDHGALPTALHVGFRGGLGLLKILSTAGRSRPGLYSLAPLRGRRPMQRCACQFLPRRLTATSSRNKKQAASRPPLRFVPSGAFVRLKPPPFGCQKGRTTPGHNQNRKDETNDLHQRKTPRHELG